MTGFITASAHWLGRHAVPALAVTLIAGAAAGGGIAYAATSSHASAPASASASAKRHPGAGRDPGTKSPGAPLAREVMAFVVKDTGLTLPVVKADLAKGESLDQIAGTNATKLEDDIVTAITTNLSKRAAKSSVVRASSILGIDTSTSAIETRVRTRVDALMAEPGTQLLQVLNAHRGVDGTPAPVHPRPPVKGRTPAATASPSAAA